MIYISLLRITTLLVKYFMKRLSLDELKSKKSVVKKLETIKGGDVASCHIPPRDSGNGGGGGSEPR
jgi:hypothetical protein